MALIICPECKKKISDKATICPHCGYPLREHTSMEMKERKPLNENESVDKCDIEKIKIKFSRKKIAVVGGIVLCSSVLFLGLGQYFGKNKLKIDAEPGVYYETSDEKIFKQEISIEPSKNYALFTSENARIDLWDGEGILEYSFPKDQEEKFSGNITAIYEIKDIKDSGISVETEELNVESANEFSIKVKTTNKNPFMLFYHYEDSEGNVPYLEDQDYYMKVITDSETLISDVILNDTLENYLDYNFIIDGIAEYKITDPNPKITLGEVEDKVDSYSWEENNHYEFRQKIKMDPKYNGFLFFNINTNGEKYKTSFCKVTNGIGEIFVSLENINDISSAPEITYGFKGFSQTEYITDYKMEIDENAQPSRAPLKYIYEKYNLLDDTVILGEDEKFLALDSNPLDMEDLDFDYIFDHVGDINKLLCLPDVVTQKMYTTSFSDGLQTKTYDDLTVSWKYHPDSGLEVLYEIE